MPYFRLPLLFTWLETCPYSLRSPLGYNGPNLTYLFPIHSSLPLTYALLETI